MPDDLTKGALAETKCYMINKDLFKVNNVALPYVIAPRRPGDIATCYADPAKSVEVLGWKAEKNLMDMCRDSWNWQSKNPMGFAKD